MCLAFDYYILANERALDFFCKEELLLVSYRVSCVGGAFDGKQRLPPMLQHFFSFVNLSLYRFNPNTIIVLMVLTL